MKRTKSKWKSYSSKGLTSTVLLEVAMKVNGLVVSGMDTVGCNSQMVQSTKVTGTLDMLMVTGSLCMLQSTMRHTKGNGLTT